MSHNICPKCNYLGIHTEHYDAFLCPTCNIWLEDICSDPHCHYCHERPESPRLAYLGKIKTFDDVHVLYSLEHFEALVVSGSISLGDGIVSSVFVDGMHIPELFVVGWNPGPEDPIARKFAKPITLEDLDKAYPNKTIQLEWVENET